MRYLFLLFTLFFFFSCQKELTIEIKNKSDISHYDQPVIIKANDLPSEFQNSGILIYDNGKLLPVQFDDLDKDGKFDELFLLVDMQPLEVKKLKVVDDEKSKSVYKKMANVRLGENKPPYKELDSIKRVNVGDSLNVNQRFLMEGIAWENDKICFRNYFDQRNGMDIYGKIVPYMVMDSVGIPGTDYHKLAYWGMDILHVGSSLGAGAIAMQIGDTIYPVRNLNNSYYYRIADGPLRAILKLSHKGFKINDRLYNIDQIISIYKGVYFYTDEVVVDGLKGDDKLVTGIVNIHSDSLYVDHPNNKFVSYYTHAVQAMDTTSLGMGILVSKQYHPEFEKVGFVANDIESTYFVKMDFENGKAVYRFYAGWERADSNFAKREYFKNIIKKDADMFASPIGINIIYE